LDSHFSLLECNNPEGFNIEATNTSYISGVGSTYISCSRMTGCAA